MRGVWDWGAVKLQKVTHVLQIIHVTFDLLLVVPVFVEARWFRSWYELVMEIVVGLVGGQ